MTWRSGWMDFSPGSKKTLKKFKIFYDWEAGNTGTLNATFENYQGDTDLFAIDLTRYPTEYEEYFTNGAMLVELFRLKIEENSLHPIKIKKVVIFYDVEPLL